MKEGKNLKEKEITTMNKTTNIILSVVIILCICVACFCVGIGVGKTTCKDNIYQRMGEVVSVSDNHDVCIATEDGNLWVINDTGYSVGESVSVVFYDNSTIDNTDDVIISVR